MPSPLLLVVVAIAAYFAAHVLVEWLGRRYLVVSGAEYLLLGILLGPRVTGLLTPEVVERFAPATTLALGWMGAAVGMRLYLADLVKVPGRAYRIALVESALTFLLVGGVEMLAIAWLYDIPLRQAALPAAALGGIATASSSAGVELAARRLNERGIEVTQLGVSVLLNAIVAVVSFGLLASMWHRPILAGGRAITATEWMVITIGIGSICGVLFHLFVGDERDTDRIFISLTGGVILVSGAASFAGLSPLLAAMVFGMILVNTSGNRDELAAAITRVERPFYLVLLVFAGAAWRPSEREWVFFVLLFLAVRVLAKLGGSRLVARANGMLPVLGPGWGWGLVGQGGLALAIALNYVYQDGGTLPYLVFTAAIASVLLTDLLSARLVHAAIAPLIARRLGLAPTHAATSAAPSAPER
jgi:Kef-type K+ transport system membrane component KefB